MEFPHGIQLFIKREYLIHPIISGNKYRKLHYNIKAAKRGNYRQLLTFGGAFSNHIAAVASAGEAFGFKTVGIIRGVELRDKIDENPTLRYARDCGMVLKFVSRSAYRNKMSTAFLRSLKEVFGAFYVLPEGGTNALAVKGCEEILTEEDRCFDVICCPVGTGGTLAGLANSAHSHQTVLGFSALKGDFLNEDIRKFARKGHWNLITDYHFGGYGKLNEELIRFINRFKKQTDIPLDPVYTGKMMYGLIALIREGYFKNGTKILAIHTGGLQGIAGMNLTLKQKQLPKII
ncbi:MAG: pyridoxal-phosphate dependent enzyme [Bacteroidota bacterium]